MEEEEKKEEEDDFFGSPAAPKQHERRHVDAALDDFDRVSDDAMQKDEGGSFWDEKEEDSWNAGSSASTQKVNSTVDRLLDDFGSMFQIKVSDNVHENVKSARARAE